MATLSTDAIPIEGMPSCSQADTTVVSERGNTPESHVSRPNQQALQIPALPTSERGNTPESHVSRPNQQGLHIPALPTDWEFNKFLLDVAKNIDDMGGLQDMKDMLRGNEGIGLKVLAETKCARELFDILRKRMMVSRYDILFLQALLRILNRPELDKLAIGFSRRMGDVVYFFPASAEPLNGYQHIQVHVEGNDFTTCTPNFIQDLKRTIGTLLFLPPRDVLIAGIEPSSSLIITIMIPETHVVYLIEMANTSIPELTKLGVDVFKIDDTTYNLHGVDDAELVETEQQRKLVTVYNQLAEKTRQLDERDIECLKLQRELERHGVYDAELVETEQQRTLVTVYNQLAEKTRQLNERDIECLNLQRELELYKSSNDLNAYILGASAYDYYVRQQQRSTLRNGIQLHNVSSLAKQSALSYFRYCMTTAISKNHDRDVILQLLDSQSKVIATSILEDQAIHMKQLQLVVQRLESRIFQLAFERDIAQLSNPAVIGNIQHVLQNLLASIPQFTQEITFDASFAMLLHTVSKGLRPRERKKLHQKYEWPDNDPLKDTIEKDRDSILACVLAKEIAKRRRNFTSGDEVVQFVAGCLLEVNRPDLKQKFLDLVSKWKQERQQAGMQQQQRGQQQQKAATAFDSSTSNIEDTVNKILERVEKIDNVIQSTQSRYDSLWGKSSLYSQSPLPGQSAPFRA